VLAVEVDQKAEQNGLQNVELVLGEFGDPKLPRRDVDVAFIHNTSHPIAGRRDYYPGARRLYGAREPDRGVLQGDLPRRNSFEPARVGDGQPVRPQIESESSEYGSGANGIKAKMLEGSVSPTPLGAGEGVNLRWVIDPVAFFGRNDR